MVAGMSTPSGKIFGGWKRRKRRRDEPCLYGRRVRQVRRVLEDAEIVKCCDAEKLLLVLLLKREGKTRRE